MNIVGNKRYDINLRYNEKTIEMVDVVYDDGTDEVHHGFAVRLSKKENNGLQHQGESPQESGGLAKPLFLSQE